MFLSNGIYHYERIYRMPCLHDDVKLHRETDHIFLSLYISICLFTGNKSVLCMHGHV